FQWIGPATIADFQAFAGIGVRAAQAAVTSLKLAPLAAGDNRMLLPDDVARFAAFRPPKDSNYVLVAGIDSIALLRRDLKALLDSKDLPRHVFVDKDTKPLGTLTDL